MKRTGKPKNLPHLVHMIPQSAYLSLETMNQAISEGLIRILLTMLTADEAAQWQRENPTHLLAFPFACTKIDELIVYQAEDMGWAMEDNDIVAGRRRAWINDPDGVEKIACYSRAWQRSVRRLRGDLAIRQDDPGRYLFKQEAVPQVRLALENLRNWLSTEEGQSSTDGELLTRFLDIVRSAPKKYFHLANAQNPDLWHAFLESKPSSYLREKITAARLSASYVLVEWLTWTDHNKNPKKTNVAISALGRIAAAYFEPHPSS